MLVEGTGSNIVAGERFDVHKLAIAVPAQRAKVAA
jgi:hypothetical protein